MKTINRELSKELNKEIHNALQREVCIELSDEI